MLSNLMLVRASGMCQPVAMSMRWIPCLWLAIAPMIRAQEAPAAVSASSISEERNLAALGALAGSLSTTIEEVDRLSAELERTESEEQKRELKSRLEAEQARIGQLRESFREMVGGAEGTVFDPAKEDKATLQEQIRDLLDPLIGALREPTARLRETEEMRSTLAFWEEREKKSARVIGRIDGWLGLASKGLVKDELESARRIWVGRHAEARGQAEVLRLKIEDRENSTPSLWESLSGMISRFWKTRGLNILLAMLAAGGGYFGVRFIYRRLRQLLPRTGSGRGELTRRVCDLLAVIAAVMVAVFAVLLVFYLRGDWLLLTLAALLLFGAAWAGKTALPPYIEQIRMLLNLGFVRENERVVHLGLPWKVRKLGFQTHFSNPELDGGELRLPLRMVMGMVSRAMEPGEPWFPCKKDDWVLLKNDIHGKIIRQTPEQVVLLRPGGSLTTYRTADFLGLSPENISRGFRVQSTFGIDYSHRPVATTGVVDILTHSILEAFVRELGKEHVKSVQVELKAAGASSLDYDVLADFTGDMAARYRHIQRRIQSICVDVCNQHGWVIPYPQLTVHHGGER